MERADMKKSEWGGQSRRVSLRKHHLCQERELSNQEARHGKSCVCVSSSKR